MKVTITVERTYDMDERRCLSEPGFAPPVNPDLPTRDRWLRETFLHS